MKEGGHHGETFRELCNVSIASWKLKLKKHEKTEKQQNNLDKLDNKGWLWVATRSIVR